VQEHADFVTSIRAGKPVNAVKPTAMATLMAIMGRESAYTGKAVTWQETVASDQRLGPMTYALGPLEMAAKAPIPGMDGEPITN